MSIFVRSYTVRASAALTGAATTYGTEFDVSDVDELNLFIVLTAQGSYTNETLDVSVQTKDPAGNWHDVASAAFTQLGNKGGTASEHIAITTFGSKLRLKYISAGNTPNYTFSVTAYGKGTV